LIGAVFIGALELFSVEIQIACPLVYSVDRRVSELACH
jgi:hypothetical protein